MGWLLCIRDRADTDRRRAWLVAFNEEHGITPRSIEKNVADIMEGAYDDPRRRERRATRVAEAGAEYADVTPATLGKAIDELEARMFRHAELLEFEEAARVRDQIGKLKEQVLKT